jgi:hypothetical protein
MEAGQLFRSCANEHVAAAALASLGGALARRIDSVALPAGLTRGVLVASLVAEYERDASPALLRQLSQRMRNSDMPILAGLRHVLEASLNGALDSEPGRARSCRWRPPPALNWAAKAASFRFDETRHALHS